MNNRKWTSAEDSKLIVEVKAHPENLTKAFTITARKTGRTFGACSNRWYSVLSKSYKDNPNNVCFAVFSKKRYGVNRKNVISESTVAKNRSIWNKIINFFKN